MSTATSNRTMLAASWKAGMVMPRNLKIHLPAAAKMMSTPAMTQQARRAMRIRSWGVSEGVMARKAGTVASGSTITKRELVANKIYSGRVISAGAGRKDGVGHAVDDFFVGGADGSQDAAQMGAGGFGPATDKIIGTETHPPIHRDQLIRVKIKPLGIHKLGVMVALQDVRRGEEVCDGFLNRLGPIGVREVAAEKNPAGAPGVGGKTGDFQDQLTL